MPEFLIKCPNPKCNSMNIEPKGKLWICRDCGKVFSEAMVQDVSMPQPPKKGKK